METRTLRTKRTGILIAMLVGLMVAAPACAQDGAAAAREKLDGVKASHGLSDLFHTVATAVKPAVVVVQVKQKVTMRRPSMEMDEFLRRFFGEEVPSPAPRRDGDEDGGREFFARGLGSGVIVDAEDGYVLTNWHVVRNADEVTVVLPDDREYEAEWVRTDPQTDLAVIKLKEAENLSAAPLGESDAVRVGDWVLAIGAPSGLQQTVTAGIISAKGRYTGRGGYQNFLQTDAAINKGNSGGPLVNMKGEVIGINSAIVSRTGVNAGIGLSIPSNMARNIMTQLIKTGEVVRGYLGVSIQEVTPGLAESLDLPDSNGALVAMVADGSPADKGGLKAEDVIVSVNGRQIDNINELRNSIAQLEVGSQAKLGIYRNGRKRTVTVEIARQPEDMAAAFGGLPGGPEGGGAATLEKYGLRVRPLTKELAEQYGYEEAGGVVIAGVEGGSDAADQGLTEGLRILTVQGQRIESVSQLKDVVARKGERGIRMLVTSPRGVRRFVFITPED